MARQLISAGNTNGVYLIDSDLPFRFTNAMTIGGWVNFNPTVPSGGSTHITFIGKVSGSFADGYVLRAEGAAFPLNATFICYINGSFRTAFSVASIASASTWYHLAGTFDGTTGTVYVNGIAGGTTFSQSGSITNAAENFLVGAVAAGAADCSNITVADVFAYGICLTPLEIFALARGVRASRVRQLSQVGYWPADGLQSPEPDLSGNGHNLSIFNGIGSSALAFGPPLGPFTWSNGSFLDKPSAPIITGLPHNNPVFITMGRFATIQGG